jgi:elongator complex protein 3
MIDPKSDFGNELIDCKMDLMDAADDEEDKISENKIAADTEMKSNQKIKPFLTELIDFIKNKSPTKSEIAKQKIVICRKIGMKKIPTDIELFLNAEPEDISFLKKFLQTKPMRTSSGVAVVAVMSAPFKCPHGKCIYCPGGLNSSFGNVPQSYTGNEPATMRGIRNNYDAYLQVMSRLEQYIAIGQSPEKVELIVLGGTFISYEKEYRDLFIRDVYQAMNDFSREFYDSVEFNVVKFKNFFELPGDIQDKYRAESIKTKLQKLKAYNEKSFEDAKNENETSKIKCVGLTIETKPDWGFLEHGNKMLDYGCTRVELGIQTLNEEILRKINRGHTLEETKRSIRELKDLGFKLNFHMMPGLPGSGKQNDIDNMKELFENPDFRPDMLKIYPTMIMPGTILEEMYIKNEYVPIEIEEMVDIVSEGMNYVEKYCRVMRIQRDIPSKFAKYAIRQNNLRQIVSAKMASKGYKEKDIKAREIGNGKIVPPVKLDVLEYDSSNGKEYFISFVDANDKLLGFARLRFPSQSLRDEITTDTALLRELHVYGKSRAISGKDENEKEGNTQHKGYGKKLMEKAEEIAKMNGKTKLLVISGIGVREYYEKIGYIRQGPYMAKSLK